MFVHMCKCLCGCACVCVCVCVFMSVCVRARVHSLSFATLLFYRRLHVPDSGLVLSDWLCLYQLQHRATGGRGVYMTGPVFITALHHSVLRAPPLLGDLKRPSFGQAYPHDGGLSFRSEGE